MHVRRSHGVASGIVLVLLGTWVAAVPYVGPHFHYSVGPADTWHWTAARLWLSLVPGVATILAGLVLVGASRRGTLVAASWVAAVAGVWVVVGPEISRRWHGTMQNGTAAGDVHHQVFEVLGYSLLSGCLIAVVGSFTLGRISVPTVQDVRHDLDIRRHDLEGVTAAQASTALSTGPLTTADAAPAYDSNAAHRRRRWRRSAPSRQPQVIDLRPEDRPYPSQPAASPDAEVGSPSPSAPPAEDPAPAPAAAQPAPGQRQFTPPTPPPAPR